MATVTATAKREAPLYLLCISTISPSISPLRRRLKLRVLRPVTAVLVRVRVRVSRVRVRVRVSRVRVSRVRVRVGASGGGLGSGGGVGVGELAPVGKVPGSGWG